MAARNLVSLLGIGAGADVSLRMPLPPHDNDDIALPIGRVTFMMTDIEGSTRLWEEHPAAMRAMLALHDAVAANVVSRSGGVLLKTRGEGDSLFAVFGDARRAAEAALGLLGALEGANHSPAAGDGPALRLRIALHTGQAEIRAGDYYGQVVNRCARVRSVAHADQVLITQATREELDGRLPDGAALVDLGSHRLRDIPTPERLYELTRRSMAAGIRALRAVGSVPNNLPSPLTSFVGRTADLRIARSLLESTRLLSLVGAGGCGKTRLALQLAIETAEAYQNGVWHVELAAIRDHEAIAPALAAALGVPERPDAPVLSLVAEHLRLSRVLIIVDGCEHLIEACARMVDELLRACPRLSIVATSREPLGLNGETIHRVSALPTPELQADASDRRPRAAQVAMNESVRLFCDRASAASRTFALTDATAPAVAQICRRLDGIPLAIELAAARTRAMTVEQIADRLGDRFQLLAAGSRTDLPHHQTLRGLFDWSYDLLTGEERRAFRRLSVFVDGWMLEAAEHLIGPSDALAADTVASLVDKSLVVYDEAAARYRMLETVREYAETRLREEGEADVARRLHRDWFVRFAESMAALLVGPQEGAALKAIETDYPNLRAAMAFCAIDDPSCECGLRIVQSLHSYWSDRGYYAEGRARCEEALETCRGKAHSPACVSAGLAAAEMALRQGDGAAAAALVDQCLSAASGLADRRLLAQAYYWKGTAARDRRELREARICYERCAEHAEAIGDALMLGMVRAAFGVVAFELEDYDEAARCFERSLEAARALGSPSMSARALGNLGCVAELRGDDDAARGFYEEALERSRSVGNRQSMATSLLNLGDTARRQKDLVTAKRLLREGYEMARDMQYRRRVAECCEALARLEDESGADEQAVRWLAAAAAIRDLSSAPLAPADAHEIDEQARGLRERMGEARFARAWEFGSARGVDMPPIEAMQAELAG